MMFMVMTVEVMSLPMSTVTMVILRVVVICVMYVDVAL